MQNQGTDDLLVNANGSFTFGKTYVDGFNYIVSIFSQPTSPNQNCLVSQSNGTINGSNITNISINCFTTTYHISGIVSGLAVGNSFFLQNNTASNIQVTANGAFSFTLSFADGSPYDINLSSPQPTAPNQMCVVTNGTGTISGADVTNVMVSCTTVQYSVKVNVLGLFVGNSFSVQNNGGDDLLINQNGSSTFSTVLDDGSAYAVTVISKPTTPSQTCVVTNGSGNISGGDAQNILIQCSIDQFNVGGTVSGLATGNTLTIKSSPTAANFVISANGSFQITPKIQDLFGYNVSVVTQPTTLNQTCVVTNGSGTVNGADVTNIAIDCSIDEFSVMVNVSGLLTGTSVTLQNNGINNLVVSQNGNATFTKKITDGSVFDVTVSIQPTAPNQECIVNNSSGIISSENITNITVVCTLAQYSIGGTISGLAIGNSVTLINNGVDNILISSNGSFNFPTKLSDNSTYLIMVFVQPTTPNQQCIATNNTGSITGDDITDVIITCEIIQYSVGGTVSGLAIGNQVVIQNNNGDDLTISTNGSFSFVTPLNDGSNYEVNVLTQPSLPNQICTVVNSTGILSGSNINDINITCVNNSAPVAVLDVFSTNEDILLNVPLNQNVLLNDTDIDGDTLVVLTTGQFNTTGIGGQITMLSNGTFNYIPPNNTSGLATFNYQISDGLSNVSASLNINVNTVNDAPSFNILGDIQRSQLNATNSTVQIPGFVNNIVFGPSDESNQSVLSINVNINSDLSNVINTLSISNNGTLTIDFTLNPGTAIVQVNLVDNGGNLNGGENTSVNVEFNISFLDIVFSNGFETPQPLKTFDYIDDFKQVNFQYYPIYDLSLDALEFNNHYLDLNNQYDNHQIQRIKSWIKEISLVDGIYLITEF